jgi:carbon starvation protein
MALNAFILTTLDTATRIGRYLPTELVGAESKYLSTTVVCGASLGLAVTGKWTLLWPAFGTSNQLIGALALLVASCWMMHRGRSVLYTFIPACVMLATTVAAFLYQLFGALTRVNKETGALQPDWFIAVVVIVLIAMALVVFWEGMQILRNGASEAVGAAEAEI